MAVVDAYCWFLYVGIGQYGRISDGEYSETRRYNKPSNSLPLPPPKLVADSEDFIVPYMFLADDAFAMKTSYWNHMAKKPDAIVKNFLLSL